MSDKKRLKSVYLEDGQIEKIEELEDSDPSLRGRGFSAALRRIINKFFGLPNGDEGEDNQKE
jgi:hypothetical protein